MRSFAVLLLSIGVLGCVGSGAAKTAAPVALSPNDPSVDAALPRLAVDARGDVFAVWQEVRSSGTFTRAASRHAGAEWGAARTLARGGYTSLAVDARGDAVVAGLTLAARQGVFAAYRPAGSFWSHAVRLGYLGPTGGEPSVAIDETGRAFVAWVSTDGRIEISARERGRWTAKSVGAGDDPAVAAGDDYALVAWHTPASRDGRFLASWHTNAAGWEQPHAIPFPAGMAVRPEQPQVTLDGRGDATAFWTNWDSDVFSSRAARGGRFGRPLDLHVGYDGLEARAAEGADGGAALTAVANRGSGPVELRVRSAASRWRAPVVLDPVALDSAIALDRSGRVLVAWVAHADTGIGYYGQLLLRLATGTSAGHVSAARTLATIGGDCWMHRCRHGGEPAVAIGPGGDAVVAWAAKTDPDHGAGVVMATDVDLSHG